MYTDYFGLTESPFAITPDPRYLFMSGRHQEALAHLLYGLKEGGGFVQLTGEVGTGKTTLTRALLEQLPDNVDVALIFNPRLTAFEFVAAVCDELHVPYPKDTHSIKVLIDAMNAYLLNAHAGGRRVVLIVDEAQNFQSEVLEQIRLLTNLETTKQKLLQIILVGQPELREMLSRPDLRQLAQRITARYHLVPMTLAETQAYIRHRLKVAGAAVQPFSAGAMKRVWRFAGGVPRLVNIVCDRALLGAYARDKKQITPAMVGEAIAELGFAPAKSRSRLGRWAAAAAIVASLGLSTLAWLQSQSDPGVRLAAEPASMPTEPVVPERSVPQPVPSDSVPVAQRGESRPDLASAPAVSAAADSAAMPSEPSFADGVAVAASAPVVPALSAQPTSSQAIVDDLSAAALRERVYSTPGTDELDQAFDHLFGQWGLQYASLPGITGCERAIGARLNCHWATGTWDDFVGLNRPALIWLDDPRTGRKHYLVVERIQDERVELRVGADVVSVGADVMAQTWNGRYLVLWRPPALDVRLIRPGDRGELVVWLRRNLERLDGARSASTHPEIFDAELRERVLAFQRAHNLRADGLVGEKTLIHISNLTNTEDVPLLQVSQ